MSQGIRLLIRLVKCLLRNVYMYVTYFVFPLFWSLKNSGDAEGQKDFADAQ